MAFPLPPPMQRALALAEQAAAAGEVPVGAIIMKGQRQIAEAANAMRATGDPTDHAEIRAIKAALDALGTGRLDGCDLWVTLEPCAMCAGAIAHVRLARLYYAVPDFKGGAVEHGPCFFGQPTCHHSPEIYSGMGQGKASELLRNFFRERRQ